jgi:succinate-semialdehyde dehydrogenase/glutarate-semialdehyde dehydrogenase
MHPGFPAHAVELARSLSKRLVEAAPGRETLTVEAPFTAEPIGTIALATRDDVAAAVARTRAAQPRWAATPLTERSAILLRFHDLLLDRRDKLLDLMQLETGKARLHAFEEIVDVAINARYYARSGPRLLRSRRRRGLIPLLTRVIEHHHPVGVVGIISPWNYPLTLAVSDALPALLAGNAVVLKPAEKTSLIGRYAVDLLVRAGVPEDVFSIVTGSGKVAGAALIDRVDCIAFTGSTAVGRQIAARAGERLIHASLELGGKNPMIVLADADLDRTVEGAVRACFTNAGQLCIAAERLYVQAPIYERFLDAFVRRTRALRVAADFSFDTEMGSLIGPEQRDKVTGHVSDALAKGAEILTGGKARPDIGPYFHEPTILAGVKPAMRVAQEETFGPVVAVYRVQDVDEAVRVANANDYGLNASIWSRDTMRAGALGACLEVGAVNVNEAYAAAWSATDAPLGGYKASGLGRRHGREGFFRFTQSQTVAAQHFIPLAPRPGQSSAAFVRMMTAILRWVRRIPGAR